MTRYITLLLLLVSTLSLRAQEVAHAITDKDCYLTGERMHVRIDITDAEQRPLSLSKVAYIEISDMHRICAQAMAQLTDGRGWADVALPATMHSGNYQLAVYTRSMRNPNQGPETFFRKVISVVNPLRVVRADDIVYLPLDSLPTSVVTAEAQSKHPGEDYTVSLSPDWQGCSITLTRRDLHTSQYDLPELKPSETEGKQIFLPEIEGHIVTARPTANEAVNITRLVMVGRMAMVCDGQQQPDNSWLYITSGLNGNLPTILNAYNFDGKPVGMEFVSPFAKVLPQSLPKLQVYCNEVDLRRRSLSAQREQAITEWQSIDSLALTPDFMSAKPHHSYDLDEYTKFSTIREILIEFVRGVRRDKHEGISSLYTFDPDTKDYSRWPALVLLDGMPVYDIDEVLEYDARLLKYVHIYTDRYTFGNTVCQGVISFISQRGRLSNYKLDSGSHLVSYQFPQDHPDFIYPAENNAGTLYWNPCVIDNRVTFKLPTDPGYYELHLQRILPNGTIGKKTELIKIF